ncbi:MAG: hypothetical protein OdinLCB4_006945 [Candidatus Odinarchaeum yellowstonii]|uniref:Uncharacterized protein n=1 Tax=Odinarchaeota yellowstonii (strain LCB_4) TaxID=1841599 RepID=A0AAF0D1W8_ODILC|nr:MAG: hypothetical protein OdinLCB4_006945 [Candidatus Odinarchaeum yellowstonii]
MSLEYEIEYLFEKVRRSLTLQKSLILRDFMANYLPSISVSVDPGDSETVEENIVDALYFNDVYKPSDMIGCAS